ncbi:hypothetical protein KIN20_005928 [Parelaphostrongylus tenuis]|uniref:Uncharacterized protein n=1 Tax=Parelaphostrongylus tenuis TaxID=148309 RepID=A0AAD5M2W0_PARTN|nr:hypothetical protein KIN20_005928 [Parelaphostrongylus tenuis]
MENLTIIPYAISVLAIISTAFGCGVMPSGQVSTRPFTVTGFTTLPLPMIYSSATNIAFPGIAPNEAAAKGFVERPRNTNCL